MHTPLHEMTIEWYCLDLFYFSENNVVKNHLPYAMKSSVNYDAKHPT